MPRRTLNAIWERQYERVKWEYEKRGTSEELAAKIAARTVKKQRAGSGEAIVVTRSSMDISS